MKNISIIILCLLAACGFTACGESDNTWNPYYNWQERNAQWFEQVADTARQNIAQAKAKYGTEWENHCAWRMYKSLQRSPETNSGKLSDSICVKIIRRGEGTISPLYNDTVRLSFRGWLMDTQYENGNGGFYNQMRVFTQTYFGEFNEATAAPSVSAISDMIDGFKTALQYMKEGDDWYVYLPQELAYGEKKQADIPAYSTLLFRIHMTAVYPAGVGVPTWKIRKW